MARVRDYAGNTRDFTSDLGRGTVLELVTGPGRRTIETGDSRDIIYIADFSPNAGPNRLDPSIPIDQLIEAADVDLTLSTGGGNDHVIAPAFINGSVTTFSTGTLTLDLGPGADLFAGIDGSAVVDGGPGRDTLFGGPGLDTVSGGAGADRLAGDFLFGNSGRDFLEVPDERDRIDPFLSPGGGRDDIFIFDIAGRDDTTTFGDFDPSADAIAIQFPFQDSGGYIPLDRLKLSVSVTGGSTSQANDPARVEITASLRGTQQSETHILKLPGLPDDVKVGRLSQAEILARIDGVGRLWGEPIEDNLGILSDSAVWLTFNGEPEAVRDRFRSDEDTRAVLSPLENDVDPDGDTLSLERIWLGGNRDTPATADGEWVEVDGHSFRIVGDRVIVRPAEDFNGRLTFRYETSDGRTGETLDGAAFEGRDVGRMVLLVDPVVDNPEPERGRLDIDPDSQEPIEFLPEDLHPDDTEIDTIEVGYVDEDGTFIPGTTRKGVPLSLDDEGRLIIDTTVPRITRLGPDDIYHDRFEVRVVDVLGNEGIARQRIVIEGQNDAPVAEDDAATVAADGRVRIEVLSNDTDPDRDDRDAIEIAEIRKAGQAGNRIELPDGTTIRIAGDEIVYVPGERFADLLEGETATDSFRYRIVDPSGEESGFARVTVTIEGVLPGNAAPVAADDLVTLDADMQRVADLFADNGSGVDSDPDAGDTFTVTAVNGTPGDVGLPFVTANGIRITVEADGSVAVDPTGSTAALELRPGEMLTETFTYTIADADGLTDTATATIEVAGVNDAPEAADDLLAVGADAGADNDAGLPTVRNLFANNGSGEDLDPDPGDTFMVTAVNGAAASVGVPFVTANGVRLIVQPDGIVDIDASNSATALALPAGETFTDTFTYEIADLGGLTDTATATLVVTGLNDDPEAADDTLGVNADAPFSGNLFADNGTGPDRDPDTGDTITITAVNGSPAAVGVPFLTSNDVEITVLADGTVEVDPTGSPAARPLPAGETFTEVFTYQVTDGAGRTDTATATVVVTGVNDAPVGANDAFAFDEDTPVAGNLFADNGAGLDSDPDTGDTFTVVAVNGSAADVGTFASLPSGIGVTIEPNGDITIDPIASTLVNALDDGDPVFEETFTYTIADADGATDTVEVTLSVTGVNDPPIAITDDQAVQVGTIFEENDPAAGLLSNDIDPDTSDADALRIVSVNGLAPTGTTNDGRALWDFSTPINGNVRVVEDGTWRYNAQEVDSSPTDSFVYEVSDGDASDTGTVDITLFV